MPQQQLPLDSSRLTADQIFENAAENARQELHRTPTALAFSGLAGGITLGLTAMSVAIGRALLGGGETQRFITALVYPMGFMAVIIGRAQLFTENTLYPVVLLLADLRYLGATAKLWTIVLFANLAGAFSFALLVAKTTALRPEFQDALIKLGVDSSQGTFGHVFWSGVVGGWLLALVAWMVSASHWTTGQIMVVWLLTFLIGVGSFAHCVATSCEILVAVVRGSVSFVEYVRWIVPAVLGNVAGGVVIVSLLNYGQVKAGQT